MQLRMLATGLLMTAGFAVADDYEARAQIAGTWTSSDSSDPKEEWKIVQEGDGLRIAHERGGKKLSEFTCKPAGEQCKYKENGRDASVMMWFNGPKLVQLETVGNDVVKRHFGVVDDGNTLVIAVIPVAPPGKTETFRYTRVPAP